MQNGFRRLILMTIKVLAYQKSGIKCDTLEFEREFCCWQALKKWLDDWSTDESEGD